MKYKPKNKVGLKRVRVSEDFIKAVREYPLQKHLLAAKCGFTPAFLSNTINGVLMVWPGDARVKKIAKVVGFSGECFGE